MTEARLTPRQKARLATIDEIKRVARLQLETEGSAGLSLRAIARELGVVSSAVYRYVPSRDELLTVLITEAYDAIGEAVETAEGAVPRSDFLGRWLAAGRAVRAWALAHPAEYALVFGSPVPGYHAPAERTVAPATRVPLVLTTLLRDIDDAGAAAPAGELPPPPAVAADLKALAALFERPVPPELLARGLAAWAGLFGLVSFELFGHFQNVVAARDAHFEHQLHRLAWMLGLRPQSLAEQPAR